MEIGEQARSAEDSILNNISTTRDLWNSVQSNQNTEMLQPKSKVGRKFCGIFYEFNVQIFHDVSSGISYQVLLFS